MRKHYVVEVDATGDITEEAPYKYVSKMRASIVVLGPILARVGHAKVSMPGDVPSEVVQSTSTSKVFWTWGQRSPRQLVTSKLRQNACMALISTWTFLVSVQHKNLMMAATLADGVTVIENAAREPEIVDLAILLNEMGAKVKGAGTETITVTGVEELHGTTHNVVQDRIEAGTFMVAAAMTGGDVLVRDAVWEHNRPLISKLLEMGVEVTEESEGIRVRSQLENLKAVHVKTLPSRDSQQICRRNLQL